MTYIHNARNMSLDRRTTEQQVDLVVTVSVASQILDDPQTRLAVRNGCIVVVLFAVFVD